MKTMKFRIGAMVGAATLAAVTLVGAVAMQDDDSAASNTDPRDSPIIYSGGYGLFPVQ